MKRKILVSPGYGAGWSTWSGAELAKFALEYQPIIDYLEGGGTFVETSFSSHEWEEPGASVLKKFMEDVAEKFGKNAHFYLGGARDLRVVEVDGPVRINEYDGFESIETPEDIEWM